MNPEWQLFRDTTKSRFDQQNFTEGADIVAEMSAWGVVRVTGADAAIFLQAHFTHDITLVDDSIVQLSGYCSPKGRLLALFYIIRQVDSYYLLMPEEIIESFVKRLGMFAQMARPTGKQTIGKVIRTAVELTDVSSDLLLLGIAGAAANAVLMSLVGATAGLTDYERQRVFHTEEFSIARISASVEGSAPRWICMGTPQHLAALWPALAEVAVPVNFQRWLLEDIRAGLPTVVRETQDKVVPQMANLQLLEGISFSKGCYPGQEIVARMQYLGTLKRRTERFTYSGEPVAAGTSVVTDKDVDAGMVLSSAHSTDVSSEALIMLKIAALGSELRLHDEDGPMLRRLALPYLTEVPGTAGVS